jgi:hypothetical protein
MMARGRPKKNSDDATSAQRLQPSVLIRAAQPLRLDMRVRPAFPTSNHVTLRRGQPRVLWW